MRIFVFIFTSLLFCSCIAIVDEKPEGRTIKSFIITEKETENIIDQVEDKPSQEKTEIFNFKDKK